MVRPPFRPRFLRPRYWLFWLGFGVLWLLVQLPYGVLLTLGRGVGWLMYACSRSRRHIAARNLALCFPHRPAAERRHLLRENFASTASAFSKWR